MRQVIVLCIISLLDFVPVVAQQSSQRQTELGHKDVAITGCLTKNAHNEFELVDKEGVDNMPYSASVDLDKYVGQNVTLLGRRASSPSAETTPGPVQVHFLVKKVESASGVCKK